MSARARVILTLFATSCCTVAALGPPASAQPTDPAKVGVNNSDFDLQKRSRIAERLVKARVKVNLTQSQFDGLVSFALSAPEAFDGPFLDAVNKKDFETATRLMFNYVEVRDPKSGRMVVDKALVSRRVAEQDMILHGVYRSEGDGGGDTQDKPWSFHCQGDLCTITSIIRNDDEPSVVAMRLEFIINRKAKFVDAVAFRLPLETRGKTFSFAFAKVGEGSDGAPKIDLAPGSTRVLTITDCDARQCSVEAQKGLLTASSAHPAMDIGAAMHQNDQMLIHYPSGPDTYATSVLLSGLQAREHELMSAPAR